MVFMPATSKGDFSFSVFGTIEKIESSFGSSTLMYGKIVGSNAQIHHIEHMFTTTSCSETYHGHYHSIKDSGFSGTMH